MKFKESFLSLAGSRSVTENFTTFKSFIDQLTSKHVPTLLLRANTKHLPWITQAIPRMCKRKQRLFSKAKRSHKSKDWVEYKNAKRETLRPIRRAHWNYINKILLEGLGERDSKPFWGYIKFRKQDSVGIAPIKQGGALHTDANMKATLLNQQFRSLDLRAPRFLVYNLLLLVPWGFKSSYVNLMLKRLPDLTTSLAKYCENSQSRLLLF